MENVMDNDKATEVYGLFRFLIFGNNDTKFSHGMSINRKIALLISKFNYSNHNLYDLATNCTIKFMNNVSPYSKQTANERYDQTKSSLVYYISRRLSGYLSNEIRDNYKRLEKQFEMDGTLNSLETEQASYIKPTEDDSPYSMLDEFVPSTVPDPSQDHAHTEIMNIIMTVMNSTEIDYLNGSLTVRSASIEMKVPRETFNRNYKRKLHRLQEILKGEGYTQDI